MPIFNPGQNTEMNNLVIAKCKDAKLDIDICAKCETPILSNVYEREFIGYEAILEFLEQQDGTGQIYFNGVNLTEENEKAYQEWLEEYERTRRHSLSQDDREPF